MLRVRTGALLAAVAIVSPGCMGGDDDDSQAVLETVTVTTTAETGPSGGTSSSVIGRIPALVERVQPSVVSVVVRAVGGQGEGSGVIWDEQGTIVTNQHVVAASEQVEVVLASGDRLPAEVEAASRDFDLAVLRVERDGLPAAEFADELPAVGEFVVAIGNPLGFENTVTAGIVSGLHRSIPSGGQTPALVDLIQTDAPISPGNSGGALIDLDGEVVGINVAYLPPGETGAVSLGFAIPAPTTTQVVEQLIETGRVEMAYLGVRPIQVTTDLAQEFDLPVDEGVAVAVVEADSAAARAGMEEGDVIVSFDGEPITTVEDLFAQLRQRRPGERVTLTVVRDGDRRELDVTLGGREGQ
jgi:S1-C subfamily serine protease